MQHFFTFILTLFVFMAKSLILKHLISELLLTVTGFEDAIQANRGTISTAMARNTSITPAIINKILHKYPQVSKDWLLTGHGEMFVNRNTDEKKDGNNNTDNSNIALSLDDNSILNTQNDTLMMNNLRQLMLSHQQNTETARLAAKAALLALENESELIKMIKQYLPKNVMA